MKKNRTGFTLVELVIVIAVIAILSAVLVPTFANIIASSKLSKDKVLVRNINLNLIAAEKQGETSKSFAESLIQLEKENLSTNDLKLQSRDMELLYDSTNNRYVIYDKVMKKVVFYDLNCEPNLSDKAHRVNFWLLADKVPTEDSLKDFSIYLVDGYSGENTITISSGIDVGNNKNININYVNNVAQTVTIRTNGGKLTIDAPNDTIYHYEKADSVNIKSVHNASYHENGTVRFVEIAGGNLVIEETAKISVLHFDATGEGEEAKFENGDGKKISLDLSKVSQENMPTFSRDNISIGENGTYVAQVTTTQTEYVWLFGNGIKEQMVTTTETGSIAENGTLKQGIDMGAEEGSVAEQIANPAKRNSEGQLVDENEEVIDLNEVDLTQSGALENVVVTEDLASKDAVELGALYFGGGSGTDSDPYIIENAIQWNNIYYDVATFKLVADLDFMGTAPEALADAGLKIIGNNHKIINMAGPLFNQNWIYDLYMENLTIADSVSDYALLCKAGCYAVETKEEFINIDVDNCVAKGGAAYLPWVYGNYNVTFKDCDITNTSISDDVTCQGFICSFVGNSKNTVVIDNCTFQGTLSAHFGVGEFGFMNGFGTVKNSIIRPGTILEHKNSGQKVTAIGGGTRENCEFYGIIKTDSSKNAVLQGYTTGRWEEKTPSVLGTELEIDTNGTITYTGDLTISKIMIHQTITTDRLKNGEFENGGFPTPIGEAKEFTNITKNSQMENAIDYITDIINVAPEYFEKLSHSQQELPEDLTFNSKGFAFKDGTIYIDASEKDGWTNYISGTLNKQPTSIEITVHYSIYDNSNVLICTTSNKYNVVLNVVD